MGATINLSLTFFTTDKTISALVTVHTCFVEGFRYPDWLSFWNDDYTQVRSAKLLHSKIMDVIFETEWNSACD